MWDAGLPGLALSWMFYLLAALLIPLFALWTVFRRRKNRHAWRTILVPPGLSLAMGLALYITFNLRDYLTKGITDADVAKYEILGYSPILITFVILVCVLLLIEVLRILFAPTTRKRDIGSGT